MVLPKSTAELVITDNSNFHYKSQEIQECET